MLNYLCYNFEWLLSAPYVFSLYSVLTQRLKQRGLKQSGHGCLRRHALSLMVAIVWVVLTLLIVAVVQPVQAYAQKLLKPTTSGFAQAGEARLYYETFGLRGEPIIFIHGVTLDRRMWDAQVRAFAQAGFRVIRYDAQNYGKSLTTPPVPDSNQTDDLRVLMDTLKISKATLIGLSMGGNIASRFALEFPERVQKLVLVSSDMNGFTGYTPELYAVFTQSFQAAAVSIDSAKKIWMSSALLTLHANQQQAQPILRQIIDDYSGDFFLPQKGLSVQPKTMTSTRLGEVKVPTLIVVGERDMKDFHMIADAYAQGIAGAKRITLTQAGHLCNMEQPAAFNAAVITFLKSKR